MRGAKGMGVDGQTQTLLCGEVTLRCQASRSLELHWGAQNTCRPCWNVFPRLIRDWLTGSPTSPICSPLGCSCCSVLRLAQITSSGGASSSHSRVRCPPRRVHAVMCGDSSGREHHQPHVGYWQFAVAHGWSGHQEHCAKQGCSFLVKLG